MPVNGRVYDFESIAIQLVGGRRQIHVQSVEYSDQKEKSHVHSMGSARPVGIGHGTYSAEGSITLLREGFNDLLAELRNGPDATLYGARFSMTVTYGNDEDDLTTDEMPLCEFTRARTGTQVGATKVEQELGIIIVDPIIRDAVPAL